MDQHFSKSLFALNLAKKYLPYPALKLLYHTLIENHLNYGSAAWGNSIYINQLEKVQKQALRVIFKRPYRAHTDPLFRKSSILKINDLYKLNMALLGYDYKHDDLPIFFRGLYSDRNIHRPTRQIHNISSTKPRTKFSSASVYHMIPKIWNELPNYTKDIHNRNSFKKLMKQIAINQYQMVVECRNPLCVECVKRN
jgi:hypothetical protein